MGINVPLISVIMTTYNHEKYVSEAIQSILNQTFTNFEFIIVNDGSTDKTDEIIRRFQDERIIYLYQENQGISAAANTAISIARGKYIALFSGDDVCYPARLDEQCKHLSKTGEKIIFSWVDFIDDDSRLMENEHFAKDFFNHENRTRAEILNWFFLKGNYICAVTAFGERETFLEAGLFNLSSIQLQDFDMWIKLIKKYNLFILPAKLVKYRVRSENNNLSANPSNSMRSLFEAYQIYKNIFDNISSELFKEAFKGNLKKSDFEEGSEYELEKAFLYLTHDSPLVKSIGSEKLFYLLQDQEVLSTAKASYSFGLPELYELTKHTDITNIKLLQQYRTELEKIRDELIHSQAELLLVKDSKFWKLRTKWVNFKKIFGIH